MSMKKIKLKRFERFSKENKIHLMAEYLLFFRFDCLGYKNNIHNNLRIISHALSTTMICLFSFLVLKLCAYAGGGSITMYSMIYTPSSETVSETNHSSEITSTNKKSSKIKRELASTYNINSVNTNILLLIFGIMGAFFWNTRTNYVSKWAYLAHLYNDVLKEKDIKIKNSLKLALVQDLVRLGFFRHESFYSVFEDTMLYAHEYQESKSIGPIRFQYKIDKKFKDKDERIKQIDKIKNKYTKKTAEKLLEKYQGFWQS